MAVERRPRLSGSKVIPMLEAAIPLWQKPGTSGSLGAGMPGTCFRQEPPNLVVAYLAEILIPLSNSSKVVRGRDAYQVVHFAPHGGICVRRAYGNGKDHLLGAELAQISHGGPGGDASSQAVVHQHRRPVLEVGRWAVPQIERHAAFEFFEAFAHGFLYKIFRDLEDLDQAMIQHACASHRYASNAQFFVTGSSYLAREVRIQWRVQGPRHFSRHHHTSPWEAEDNGVAPSYVSQAVSEPASGVCSILEDGFVHGDHPARIPG